MASHERYRERGSSAAGWAVAIAALLTVAVAGLTILQNENLWIFQDKTVSELTPEERQQVVDEMREQQDLLREGLNTGTEHEPAITPSELIETAEDGEQESNNRFCENAASILENAPEGSPITLPSTCD